jgi:hypothetical protein
METLLFHNIEHLYSCVLLQCLIALLLSAAKARDHLRHSEPEVLVDLVTCELYQLNDHVDIPAQVDRELFRQDGNLEDHFFHQFVVVGLEMIKQLVHHFTSHVLVAERKD